MDRLSAYAQRESETESPEQRQKTEEESISKLLEQLRLAKEKKPAESETSTTQQNGDASDEGQSSTEEGSITSGTTAVPNPEEETAEAGGEVEKKRGIPSNIKLFEIFHEQVATLVKMQRLSIQDTVGLLVSLANLAL
jgi:vacuolar protein sorting-associated protein 35